MSFHERAVKADKETIKTMKERLLKKYPYIDLSRFTILTHLCRGLAHEVDYDIEGDNKAHFCDNKQLTQYLYANRPFPLMWNSGGIIQNMKT